MVGLKKIVYAHSRNCILHDGVTIEDNCQLEGCIVADNVYLGKDVVVHQKAVLGPGKLNRNSSMIKVNLMKTGKNQSVLNGPRCQVDYDNPHCSIKHLLAHERICLVFFLM